MEIMDEIKNEINDAVTNEAMTEAAEENDAATVEAEAQETDAKAEAAAKRAEKAERNARIFAEILRGQSGMTAREIAWAFEQQAGQALSPAAVPALIAKTKGARIVGRAYDGKTDTWVPTYAITDEDGERTRAVSARRLMAQHHIAGPQGIYTRSMSDCPALDAELIEGHMRNNSIGIISAPPKAGKSWLVLELAIACTAGENHAQWLGLHVAQTPVLYVNLELKDTEVRNRIERIKSARGIDYPLPNLRVLTLRGRAIKITDLVTVLTAMVDQIRATEGVQIGLIIIDPLYRIIDGDENSNADVTAAYAQVSALNEQTGASVMIVHHYAKGNSALKSVLDRGVGAGVFSRAPDCIMTLSRLDNGAIQNAPDGATAFRLETIARSFPESDPIDVWWQYPTFTRITDGSTDGVLLEGQDDADTLKMGHTKEVRDKVFGYAADSIIRYMIENANVTATEKDPTVCGIDVNTFITEFANRIGYKPTATTVRGWLRVAGYSPLQKKPAELYGREGHPIMRTANGYAEIDTTGSAKRAAEASDRAEHMAQAVADMGGPAADNASGNSYGNTAEIERRADAMSGSTTAEKTAVDDTVLFSASDDDWADLPF
ncbi:AAA family ATPase [Galactobacillus timonensis]|uniref:AAA family ATPase n=1 Tax=Galactobacillus timonensis TaxID=2041840 RepID=UPI000C82C661|nr:AAA family ATPase [Galactobacillus timonensis]